MPTKIVATPSDELPIEKRQSIASAAQSDALQTTSNALSQSEDELVLRDLQPEEDLGQSNNRHVYTVNNADQFDEVINHELDDGKTVSIHALAFNDADPDVTAIQFAGGANTINEVTTEDAFTQEQPVLYLESPVKYEENSTISISFYAESTGDKNVVLKGQVAEKEGENVSPSDA